MAENIKTKLDNSKLVYKSNYKTSLNVFTQPLHHKQDGTKQGKADLNSEFSFS